MQIMSTIDDLAAALNGRQVTDDEGQISSDSATEQVDSLESESVPTETVQEEPKPLEQEPEEAEDDNGNKYIPKKRFDKVWGEKKSLERELASFKQQVASQPINDVQEQPFDKTQALEIELLYEKYPEFNPTHSKYSEELDLLAGKLVKANPQLTALQAAREARELASKIASRVGAVKTESVTVKQSVSDNGMAGRTPKVSSDPVIDPKTASADELERFLKQTGNW